MQKGPVFIIDDDPDDQDIVREIWKELGFLNELVFFSRAEDLYEHMLAAEEAPFIIISDVNLPKMNGFELRKKLLDNGSRKMKSVPFIFWSTNAPSGQIEFAYDLAAHGFFVKGTKFEEVKETLKTIVEYWLLSKMPTKHD